MRRLKKQQLRSDAQQIRTISVILISFGDGAQVLKATPGVTTVGPSAQATVELKPLLRRWLITAGPLAAVHVAVSDPTHGFAAKE